MLKKKYSSGYIFGTALCAALIIFFAWLMLALRATDSHVHLTEYYAQITQQESVRPEITIAPEELAFLRECKYISGALAAKKSQECYKRFYSDYTRSHGARDAFDHLALLTKNEPSFSGDCHYISHGIGHAQLQLYGGDAGRAFATLSEEAYFKNVATCGNGYFHGIIEEYAKNETRAPELATLLRDTCLKILPTKNAVDCYHGIGHASYIQLDYDTTASLDICDKVTDDGLLQYSCHMGVFMEMAQSKTTRELVTVTNGVMDFTLCNTLAEKYRLACYAQHSVFFENFSADPSNYPKSMRACSQITNPAYRMACVKFFAGRALRVGHYTDLRELCQRSTSSHTEMVACTAVFASRIARSLDASKTTPLYTAAVADICATLPWLSRNECRDLVRHDSQRLYYDPDVPEEM
jgi:hypothetical protein